MALASYTLGAGRWATFGLALPEGAATDAVQVGAFNTQTDVKNVWSDGSIRFAVVTVESPTAGTHDLEEDTNSVSTFTPTYPAVTVEFDTGADTYTATLPSFSAVNAWLNGALVRENRFVVTAMNGMTPHPLLQVVFDVRVYSDGKYRVDICGQNTKDISASDSVAYDLTINVDASPVFTKAGVTHWAFCRWRKTFYSTAFTPATVSPDFEPFYRARALQRFLPEINDHTYVTSGSDYELFGFAGIQPAMPAPGGRSDIGAYPWWEAQYLVHKTTNLLTQTLEAGNHSGSWSMHITESDGTSLITLENYPEFWFDGRATVGHPDGPVAARAMDGSLKGVRPDPAIPDNQHIPSVSFVPYMITGDRYYADQMKFWASWSQLATYPGDSVSNGVDFGRQQSMGLLAQNGNRGFAWPLRELADVSAYLPDDDADKAYFTECLNNNLAWLENYAVTTDGGPSELIFVERSNDTDDPGYSIATLWQSSYLGYAIDRAIGHGFGPDGTSMRDRIIRSQVKFLTSQAEGFPQLYGCPYYPRLGTFNEDDEIVLFETMGDIWDNNYDPDFTDNPNPQQPIIGFYGPEAYMLLTIGVRESIDGADDALAFLLAYADGGGTTVLDDIAERGGFGITFDEDDLPPEEEGPDSTLTLGSGTLDLTGFSTVFVFASPATGLVEFNAASGEYEIQPFSLGVSDLEGQTSKKWKLFGFHVKPRKEEKA